MRAALSAVTQWLKHAWNLPWRLKGPFLALSVGLLALLVTVSIIIATGGDDSTAVSVVVQRPTPTATSTPTQTPAPIPTPTLMPTIVPSPAPQSQAEVAPPVVDVAETPAASQWPCPPPWDDPAFICCPTGYTIDVELSTCVQQPEPSHWPTAVQQPTSTRAPTPIPTPTPTPFPYSIEECRSAVAIFLSVYRSWIFEAATWTEVQEALLDALFVCRRSPFTVCYDALTELPLIYEPGTTTHVNLIMDACGIKSI